VAASLVRNRSGSVVVTAELVVVVAAALVVVKMKKYHAMVLYSFLSVVC
jgi:hypothetical protein